MGKQVHIWLTCFHISMLVFILSNLRCADHALSESKSESPSLISAGVV
jgi:hypothetical protein